MPNKTVYIRKDDLEAWNQVEDVPDFIHRALHGVITARTLDQEREWLEEDKAAKAHEIPKGMVEVDEKGLADIFNAIPVGSRPDLCPHHMIWGQCGFASCKKIGPSSVPF
jgi:hypothetical protein